METGQNQARDGGGSKVTPLGTMNVPLNVITQTFQALAKRANTREQKHYLFVTCEALGTSISKQYPGGGPSGGFNSEEWMTECGVQHEWATIAA